MKVFKIDNIKDFNLDHIFDCGQCFRWERQEDGSYTGVAMGQVVNMAFDGDETLGVLTITGADEADYNNIWKKYLDLDRDYGAIKKTLGDKDSIIAEAIKYGEGIRILKQDLWETIVSFIISQNNNIPRIKGCIENLSKAFGTYAGQYNGREYYNIPSPEVLSNLTIEDLGPIKLGYRAKYLIESSRQVLERGNPDGFDTLTALTGVGPKVANCIRLFGLSQMDSFPIDVWVKRVMNRLYGFEEKDVAGMTAFADRTFGELGGIAQQYLFYYIRETSGE